MLITRQCLHNLHQVCYSCRTVKPYSGWQYTATQLNSHSLDLWWTLNRQLLMITIVNALVNSVQFTSNTLKAAEAICSPMYTDLGRLAPTDTKRRVHEIITTGKRINTYSAINLCEVDRKWDRSSINDPNDTRIKQCEIEAHHHNTINGMLLSQ